MRHALERDTDRPIYTLAQASAITDVSSRSINRAIDRGPIPRKGKGPRMLTPAELVFVRAYVRSGAGTSFNLSTALQKRLYAAVVAAVRRRSDRVALADYMTLDIARATSDVEARARKLAQADKLIVTDPGIRGGEPVIRGTRISPYEVAAMLSAGATKEELLEGYPTLTGTKIELACLYAQAHPRRGRPRTRPWHANPRR